MGRSNRAFLRGEDRRLNGLMVAAAVCSCFVFGFVLSSNLEKQSRLNGELMVSKNPRVINQPVGVVSSWNSFASKTGINSSDAIVSVGNQSSFGNPQMSVPRVGNRLVNSSALGFSPKHGNQSFRDSSARFETFGDDIFFRPPMSTQGSGKFNAKVARPGVSSSSSTPLASHNPRQLLNSDYTNYYNPRLNGPLGPIKSTTHSGSNSLRESM